MKITAAIEHLQRIQADHGPDVNVVRLDNDEGWVEELEANLMPMIRFTEDVYQPTGLTDRIYRRKGEIDQYNREWHEKHFAGKFTRFVAFALTR